MAVNARALRARQPGGAALARYDEIASILTGQDGALAEDGVAWVKSLAAALNVPSLAAYGITAADFPALVEKTAVASSTKANPIALTPEELGEILALAL
jgi:alcohol dehydrogenase class IV